MYIYVCVDVMNVAGHRIGTAEVESALVAHRACAEAAVIGIPHDLKGCVQEATSELGRVGLSLCCVRVFLLVSLLCSCLLQTPVLCVRQVTAWASCLCGFCLD